MRKRYLIPILACVLLLFCCTAAYAHPGNTDSNGGHYDHSTGKYHYHHGYPAHQHPDGRCPYNYDDRTGQNSGPSTSGREVPKPTERKSYANLVGIILFFLVIGYLMVSSEIRFKRRKQEQPQNLLTPRGQPRPKIAPPPAPRQQSASKPPVANTAPPPEPSPHPALQREVEVSKPREVEPEPPSRLNAADTYLYSLGGRDVTLYGVESSYISHVGYLFSQEQLFVRMKSGRVYTYNRIPPELYWEFVHADSIGEFYNRYIKASRRRS